MKHLRSQWWGRGCRQCVRGYSRHAKWIFLENMLKITVQLRGCYLEHGMRASGKICFQSFNWGTCGVYLIYSKSVTLKKICFEKNIFKVIGYNLI